MNNHYDVIIVGAGPAGIFTACELIKNKPGLKILMLEKGNGIYKRKCPKHTNGGTCVHCKPCNITTGWAGAGAYSDGKLSLSHEVGEDRGGITPGLMHASVNGVLIAREILKGLN